MQIGLNEAIRMKMRKLIKKTVSADSLMDLDHFRMFQTLNFTQGKSLISNISHVKRT